MRKSRKYSTSTCIVKLCYTSGDPGAIAPMLSVCLVQRAQERRRSQLALEFNLRCTNRRVKTSAGTSFLTPNTNNATTEGVWYVSPPYGGYIRICPMGVHTYPHRAEALSDAFVWRLSDVCLSVAYIGPNSRKERPRKTKIGTEVAHVTRDADSNLDPDRHQNVITCC